MHETQTEAKKSEKNELKKPRDDHPSLWTKEDAPNGKEWRSHWLARPE